MNAYERPRNWRWQLIEELDSANRRLPTHLKRDEWIVTAYKFRNAFQRMAQSSTPTVDTMAVADKYPDLYAAFNIYSGMSLERYFIEALIMAGVPAEEIAETAGYRTAAIDSYEALFFDVRRNLDKPLYVLGNILGPMFSTGTSGVDYDHLWKAIGYYCGPEILKALWKVGPLPEESQEKLTEILRARMAAQATGAAFSRKPNSFNAGEIISNFIDYSNLEINKIKLQDDDHSSNSEKGLDQLDEDILDYVQLKLVPHDAKKPRIEKQLAVDSGDEDQYERPAEFSRSD